MTELTAADLDVETAEAEARIVARAAAAEAREAAELAAVVALEAAEVEAVAAAQAQADRVAGLRIAKHPRGWDAAQRLLFSGVFTVDKAAPASHGRPHWSNLKVNTILA